METLDCLPIDLWIHTITFLTISDIRPLHLLSRRWLAFVTEHADFIYRNAAHLHRFIKSLDTPLSSTAIRSMQMPDTIPKGWKSFCE
jgi:hypothetical protein